MLTRLGHGDGPELLGGVVNCRGLDPESRAAKDSSRNLLCESAGNPSTSSQDAPKEHCIDPGAGVQGLAREGGGGEGGGGDPAVPELSGFWSWEPASPGQLLL